MFDHSLKAYTFHLTFFTSLKLGLSIEQYVIQGRTNHLASAQRHLSGMKLKIYSSIKIFVWHTQEPHGKGSQKKKALGS